MSFVDHPWVISVVASNAFGLFYFFCWLLSVLCAVFKLPSVFKLLFYGLSAVMSFGCLVQPNLFSLDSPLPSRLITSPRLSLCFLSLDIYYLFIYFSRHPTCRPYDILQVVLLSYPVSAGPSRVLNIVLYSTGYCNGLCKVPYRTSPRLPSLDSSLSGLSYVFCKLSYVCRLSHCFNNVY